jgi:hypothetical protein
MINSFDVLVDGKLVKRIKNKCLKPSYKLTRITVPSGKHVVKIVTVNPTVVIFGVSFEKTKGVVVDGFGIGGANIYHLNKIKSKFFERGLKERNYDLVILGLGTNLTWYLKTIHDTWIKRVIIKIRRALGRKVSILIMSPPPRGSWSRGRIVPFSRANIVAGYKRNTALKYKCAYWDYLKAAGGTNSIGYWYRKGFFWRDLIHMRPKFHKHMSGLLYQALVDNFNQHRGQL